MTMSKVNFYDIYIHFNDDIMLEPSFSVNYKAIRYKRHTENHICMVSGGLQADYLV